MWNLVLGYPETAASFLPFREIFTMFKQSWWHLGEKVPAGSFPAVSCACWDSRHQRGHAGPGSRLLSVRPSAPLLPSKPCALESLLPGLANDYNLQRTLQLAEINYGSMYSHIHIPLFSRKNYPSQINRQLN